MNRLESYDPTIQEICLFELKEKLKQNLFEVINAGKKSNYFL